MSYRVGVLWVSLTACSCDCSSACDVWPSLSIETDWSSGCPATWDSPPSLSPCILLTWCGGYRYLIFQTNMQWKWRVSLPCDLWTAFGTKGVATGCAKGVAYRGDIFTLLLIHTRRDGRLLATNHSTKVVDKVAHTLDIYLLARKAHELHIIIWHWLLAHTLTLTFNWNIPLLQTLSDEKFAVGLPILSNSSKLLNFLFCKIVMFGSSAQATHRCQEKRPGLSLSTVYRHNYYIGLGSVSHTLARKFTIFTRFGVTSRHFQQWIIIFIAQCLIFAMQALRI